jgi:hypothetical protein
MVMTALLPRLRLAPLLLILLLTGNSEIPTGAGSLSQACAFDPLISDILGQASMESWMGWIEKLSGASPVYELGYYSRIHTRRTDLMFGDRANARAYDYVHHLLQTWYPEQFIEQHVYSYPGGPAKNLILTIRGASSPDEYVLLVAHLDSTSRDSALAPGANDNATGSATLLEAARLFRYYRFERTVQLVWFTGEESGLIGSQAFVSKFADRAYQAVINLDMFGWDGDGDRCFELHVGDLPQSQRIGSCVADTIQAYGLELKHDFLIEDAITLSDHASFWDRGIGAIAIVENWVIPNQDQPQIDGCQGVDRNPHYHTSQDTVAENLTPEFGFDVARASLGAVAALAIPSSECFQIVPELSLVSDSPTSLALNWDPVPGAEKYRILRSSYGCSEGWQVLAETDDFTWQDEGLYENWPYQYRIEALPAGGSCVSQPSPCLKVGPLPPPRFSITYLPVFSRWIPE